MTKTSLRLHVDALALASLALLALPVQAVDYTWSSGFWLGGDLAPGDTLRILPGSSKYLNSDMSNAGAIYATDVIYLQSGHTLANGALYDLQADVGLADGGGATPTFNNTGILRKSAGLGNSTIGSIAFVNSGIIDAQTGTITFSGGNATFNAGSQFIGAGATVISSNAAFNGAFTSANLSLSAGLFTGGAAQINGSVNLTGGTVTGSWEIAAGQSLTGNSGVNKTLSAAVVSNNSNLLWQSGDALRMQSGSSFTNNALHDIQASSSITNAGGALSSYVNNSGATLRVAAGQTADIGSIAFVNDGGMLTANGALIFGGGIATFNNGTLFNGSGTNLVTNHASFNGAIASGNLVLQSGIYTGGAALLGGTTIFTGGIFTGSWELASGQVLKGLDGGNKYLSTAAFTNKGNVQWQSGDPLLFQSGASFDNQGTFDMIAGMTLANNGGALSSFTNSGTLGVAAGQSGSVGAIAFVNNGGTLDVAAGGTLTFGGANARFNTGTRFTGAGVNLVTHDARFVDDFSSQNLRLAAGNFYGGDGTPASKAVVGGVVEFAGGVLTGNWELGSGQVLKGLDGGNKYLSSASLTNKGNLQWQTTNALNLQAGAVLDNQGTFDMFADMTVANGGGALSTFVNNHRLTVAAGKTASIGAVAFVNSGALDVAGTLNFDGGNASFNTGSSFTGAGTVAVNSNAAFSGAQTSSNLALRAGDFTGSGALLNGSTEFSGGRLQGSWTVAGGALLKGSSGGNKYLSAAALTNQGTMAWQTGETLFVQSGTALANQGTLDLQADAAIAYGGGAIGSFVNTGLIVKTGGVGSSTIGNNLGFDNQGVVDVRTGTVALPANFVNAGTLTGSGIFAASGTLTSNGHIAPGSSPGTLTINSHLLLGPGGSLDVELESLASHDSLVVGGDVGLGGTLAVSCYGACSFSSGQEVLVLDASGTLSGSFLALTASGFSSIDPFEIRYDWPNGDVWLRATQDVTAVPEPASHALLLGGLALVGWVAGRRRAA